MRITPLAAVLAAALAPLSCGCPPSTCNDPPTTRIVTGTYRTPADGGVPLVVRIDRAAGVAPNAPAGLEVRVTGPDGETTEETVERLDMTLTRP